MNHKRRRPKHQRSGCLMCKPHKDDRGGNSADRAPLPLRRRDTADREAIRDAAPETPVV
jgi:hypothetical protein